MKLEDLKSNQSVKGLVPDAVVEVVQVDFFGADSCEVVFRKPGGGVDSQILYRSDESRLTAVKSVGEGRSFDADGRLFRLVSEALRIQLAHLYDERMAVHSSNVQPLPHQITAVYEFMLNRHPLRFLLADDPGAGKTIMAGLLIKELIARGDVQRCMIVCPGGLVEQWQEELDQRFNLPFEIMTNDKLEASRTGNWMAEEPFIIGRLDKLARDESLHAKMEVEGCEWDLIIVDEAHKMSASYFGQKVNYTRRFNLGRKLSKRTRHFLLMTATPHNGKEEDFQLFMSLIDPDRFEGKFRNGAHNADVKDMMRRMVKEELLKFDGTPLFPERIAYTLGYDLSPSEAVLYEKVTEYVREQYNRADRLQNGNRKGTVGFALTMLQRRLASSPEAICRSLERRTEKLELKLQELATFTGAAQFRQIDGWGQGYDADNLEDWEDGVGEENEELLDEILDQSTAAATKEELDEEVKLLKILVSQAREVRRSGRDMKWTQLSGLLNMVFADPDFLVKVQEASIPFGKGADVPSASPHQKLVIFTEHKDTLHYLQRRIDTLFGGAGQVVTIHGGVRREERLKAQEMFKFDPEIRVLLATDAAGEGINLQRAHLMVNYDLPWNPNRLEQRFGRIHRIGQREVCHLWNLVANNTREGDVYTRLFEKLEQAREALGGKVFDVLGKIQFDGKPLRDLLLEAIRYGNQPEVRSKLFEKVGGGADVEKLRRLLEEGALANNVMDTTEVERVREDMELASMRRLQPQFVSSFFKAAFEELGGSYQRREKGRLQINRVPARIKQRDRVIGSRAVLLDRYERIAFSKEHVAPEGLVRADFVCPGHPLLDTLVDLTLEKHKALLTKGAVLVDRADRGTEPKLVYYLEHSVLDGHASRNESKRTISKHLMFIEMTQAGELTELHYAPYLDYEPLGSSDPSVATLLSHEALAWVRQDHDRTIKQHVIAHVLPKELEAIKGRRMERIAKERQEVRNRLTMEIQHWDRRATELSEKEAAGKRNARLNSNQAKQRADDLDARLESRMAELDKEEHIVPGPVNVLGGIVVIPQGLLDDLQGRPQQADHGTSQVDRMAIAAKARSIVMDIERRLGFEPEDVEFDRKGWDVQSKVGDGSFRFIEVKGRDSMGETITVTHNEIKQGRQRPECYFLAMVLFDADGGHDVRYLREPWNDDLDLSTTSVSKNLQQLWNQAEKPI